MYLEHVIVNPLQLYSFKSVCWVISHSINYRSSVFYQHPSIFLHAVSKNIPKDLSLELEMSIEFVINHISGIFKGEILKYFDIE